MHLVRSSRLSGILHSYEHVALYCVVILAEALSAKKTWHDCEFCATDASQPEADEPLAHARREISPAPQNPGPDGLFPRSFPVEKE